MNTHLMDSSAFYDITNQPELWIHIVDRAPMHDLIRKPLVAVVRAHEEIEGPSRHPVIHISARQALPCKRSAGFGLTQAIDMHCVVTGSSTKPISPATLVNINKRSRVDQH